MTGELFQAFAKVPIKGQIKTCLMPDLGIVGACRAYYVGGT